MALSSDVERICRDCGAVFVCTADEQAFLARVAAKRGTDWDVPLRCWPCRRERKKVVDDGSDELIVCTGCSRSFQMDAGEKRYFAERGYLRRRYCPFCREAQRRAREVG